MDEVLKEIQSSFQSNGDFIMLEQQYDEVKMVFFGLNTLIDFPSTMPVLEKLILSASKSHTTSLFIQTLGQKMEKSEQIQSEILKGSLILHIPELKQYFSIKAKSRTLERSIEAPMDESVLSGPRSSFNEELSTNIGLIRKQLLTKDIVIKNFTIGEVHQKQLSLLYLKGKTNQRLVEAILEQIEKRKKNDVQTIQDIMHLLDIATWTLVPKFNLTELPQEVSQALLKGKVVFIIDRLPLALILPSQITDLFFLENDRNFLFPIMLVVRFLRILGMLIAVLAPGLYIALVSVNPEVLRIELALSIAQSREGVPYPALLEVMLMLLVLELILEASVRLPKSIGPTITMVGGIILGQAAVDAKLVSNLLIIILAATMIANSTLIGFQNSISIRLSKYIVVLLAAIYGILGIIASIFIICSYLASLKTFDIPYINSKWEQGDTTSG